MLAQQGDGDRNQCAKCLVGRRVVTLGWRHPVKEIADDVTKTVEGRALALSSQSRPGARGRIVKFRSPVMPQFCCQIHGWERISQVSCRKICREVRSFVVLRVVCVCAQKIGSV